MKRLSLWSSILALLIGIFLFVHPFTTTAMIGWIIAFLVFMSGITGILRLIGGIQMSRAGFYDANRFLSSAVLAILLGLFLLFNPALSAIFIGRLTGLLLMAVGVSGIAFSFRI